MYLYNCENTELFLNPLSDVLVEAARHGQEGEQHSRAHREGHLHGRHDWAGLPRAEMCQAYKDCTLHILHR